jgi:hypothetical protein
MAHSLGDWTGRLRCSYKRATVVLCSANLFVLLFMVHAYLSYNASSSSSSLSSPAPGAIGASLNGARSLSFFFLSFFFLSFFSVRVC